MEVTSIEEALSIHEISFMIVLPSKSFSMVEEKFRRVANNLKFIANFSVLYTDSDIDFSYSIQKIERNRSPLLLLKGESNVPDEINESDIESFVRHNNHQLMTLFDTNNFKQLGKTGKRLIVAVLDISNKDLSDQILLILDKEISNIDIQIMHKYVIGYIDGVKWKKYFKKFGAYAPSILVLDMKNDGFYVEHDVLSTEIVHQLITNVITNDIEGMFISTADANFFHRLRSKFRKYSPWSYVIVVLPTFLCIINIFVPYPKDKND